MCCCAELRSNSWNQLGWIKMVLPLPIFDFQLVPKLQWHRFHMKIGKSTSTYWLYFYFKFWTSWIKYYLATIFKKKRPFDKITNIKKLPFSFFRRYSVVTKQNFSDIAFCVVEANIWRRDYKGHIGQQKKSLTAFYHGRKKGQIRRHPFLGSQSDAQKSIKC